jgi:competence ComEA-like helix-hairpin-helix protein
MDDQSTLVNLNTAEREELMTLPGVGPAIADRILESRPFTSIDDLRRVSGIGSNFVEGIRTRITLNNDSTSTAAPTEPAPVEMAAEEPPEHPAEVSPPDVEPASEAGEQLAVQPPTTGAESEGHMEPLEEESQPAEVQPETPSIESAEELPVKPVSEVEPVGAAAVAEPVEARPETQPVEQAPEPEPAEEAPESSGAVKVFTVPEGQTPGPQAEFTPPPAQPAAPATQPRAVTRSQALWMAIGTGFLALVLAFVLSLGVLAAINGGLRFVSPADLNALGRKVDGVTTQTQILQQDLDGLRGRVDNLEGLSGRMSTVEGQAKQLRTDLDAASQQVQQINQQMTQVSSDIKDLQSQTGRFQGFLDGLKSLLNQVTQP